jgi:hypothetical protein
MLWILQPTDPSTSEYLGTYPRPGWIIALLGRDRSLVQVTAPIEIVPQIQVLELVLVGIGTATVPS